VQLEQRGLFEEARNQLRPWWPKFGSRPETDRLEPGASGELLLRSGHLTGLLGSARQFEEAQEIAKNLLTESRAIFEQLQDVEKQAEATKCLALCYWREGSPGHAKAYLEAALKLLEETDCDQKGFVLINLGVMTREDKRYREALQYYDRATHIVEESDNLFLKGIWHGGRGLLFKDLATCSEDVADRELYFNSAIYENGWSAEFHKIIGNARFQARAENNIGRVYLALGRYNDAHEHLDRARELIAPFEDLSYLAQIDHSSACVLLAEGLIQEAEKLVNRVIFNLHGGDELAIQAEVLITRATALARLGRPEEAYEELLSAIKKAETAQDPTTQGLGWLVMAEELSAYLDKERVLEAGTRAGQLLERAEDATLKKRVIAATESGRMTRRFPSRWDGFQLDEVLFKFEEGYIMHALHDASRKKSAAARLLGISASNLDKKLRTRFSHLRFLADGRPHSYSVSEKHAGDNLVTLIKPVTRRTVAVPRARIKRIRVPDEQCAALGVHINDRLIVVTANYYQDGARVAVRLEKKVMVGRYNSADAMVIVDSQAGGNPYQYHANEIEMVGRVVGFIKASDAKLDEPTMHPL
jgi:tetratricopeptide (TPR) repeat protein